eukprot:g25037.t1
MSSDSEEEQLFAMVGHTAIMAQDFSSLDDPEPELEVQGFAPRDLWVVEEEEEVSEEERKESEEEVTDAEAEVEKNKDDLDERASGKDDDLSQKVQDEAYSRSTECSDQGEPRAYTAASLLQAVYRGRLARLELFRACAAGTPANWRSLRLRTETAMARSAEEVAARVLQAAWRSCQARKDANWHGNANDANVFAGSLRYFFLPECTDVQ